MSLKSLGEKNPYRYRGYRYDNETGYYYLQSRYYNPEWGRFLNADGLVSTGQGMLSHNMFIYCLNNPASNKDDNGFLCSSAVEGATTWKDDSNANKISKVVYYGRKLIVGTGEYQIGNSIAKAYKNSVTKSYTPINLSLGGINVQTFKDVPKVIKMVDKAGKWGIGAISAGSAIFSVLDNNMNYSEDIALKRNMVDVISFAAGCGAAVFIGASALPVTFAAGLTIGAGILIGISVDMFKESVSN